jgi:acetyltransferase
VDLSVVIVPAPAVPVIARQDAAHGVKGLVVVISAGFKETGARGAAKSDIEELEICLLRLSALAIGHPEIAELDINPLIVHEQGQGCSVADCRILLDLDRVCELDL